MHHKIEVVDISSKPALVLPEVMNHADYQTCSGTSWAASAFAEYQELSSRKTGSKVILTQVCAHS